MVRRCPLLTEARNWPWQRSVGTLRGHHVACKGVKTTGSCTFSSFTQIPRPTGVSGSFHTPRWEKLHAWQSVFSSFGKLHAHTLEKPQTSSTLLYNNLLHQWHQSLMAITGFYVNYYSCWKQHSYWANLNLLFVAVNRWTRSLRLAWWEKVTVHACLCTCEKASQIKDKAYQDTVCMLIPS